MTKPKIKQQTLGISLRTRDRAVVFMRVNEVLAQLCKEKKITYAHALWIE